MITKEKRKRAGICAAAALVIFCAAGCQKKAAQDAAKTQKEGEGVAAVAQISDGALTEDAVVMAVGIEAVTCREAQFYLQQVKEKYEPALSEKIWDITIEDGETFADYVKDEVIREITEVKIICQEAGNQSITLSRDELTEASLLAADFVEKANGSGNNPMHITDELAAKIYEDHMLAEKMFNVATADVNTSISDEEARQITVQYLKLLTRGTDKNGAAVNMNPEEKKQAKKRAEELLKQAKETKNFYNFAEEKSDDEQVELTFGQDNKPAEFGDLALALKQGEFSSVIEGESAYYILYCISSFDEEATNKRKEEIIKVNQDEVFQKAYREWSQNYEVLVSTTLWDQMKL